MPTRPSPLFTLTVALLAAAILPAAVRPEAFALADAAVVKAKCADAKAARSLARAAAELTNVMFKVTGRMPTVCEEDAVPPEAVAEIHLGETAAARAAGLAGGDLRLGDWRVVSMPGKAFLYGRTPYAVGRAVFEFAERHCGYHVLNVDGHDVYTPNPALTVPVADVTVRPAIYGRHIYHGMYDGKRYPETKSFWERYAYALGSIPPMAEGRFRVSMQTKTLCHSSFAYLPPEKWFKEHPEYYSMRADGRRHAEAAMGDQLCYSNPDVYRLVLESLERFVAADRAANPDDPPLMYDFTQQDNASALCLCPECRKTIAKYNRTEGGHKEGGDAGLQLEFVNRLARDIRRKYPDVIIRTFAYVSTECAPKPGTIAIEPNVCIWWCDVYSRSDHTLPLETPDHFNMHQVKELEEWLALTKNIQVWDYMLYTDDFPELSPDALKADAAFFARHGLEHVFLETEYHGQPLYELNHYLAAKLYVNPSADVDALIRTFCRCYGKGADDMFAAVQDLRRAIVAAPATNAVDWHSRTLPWLQDRGPVLRFAARAQAAYDKTGGEPLARARIVPALASAWKQLVMAYRKDPSAGAAYIAAQENYRRYAKETARTAFMEPTARAKAAAKVDETLELLTLKFKDLPDELKAVPEGDLVCVDHHCAMGRRQDDPLSERGRTVAAKDYKAMPVPCGVYDSQTKDSVAFRIAADRLKPGAYAWVKLGRCRLGRDSIFWFPGSWRSAFRLKDFYILADGASVDPNRYEIWASVREGEGAFLIDRLALRRVR